MSRVPIAQVQIGDRRRQLDAATVTALAGSISKVGLLQPIVVTEGRALIAGRHRLEACRSLGWETIPAVVSSLGDLHRELAEIDENLIRAELTELERGESLARRKQLYEALHPEARPVTERGGPGRGKKTNDNLSPVSFAADIAAKMGTSDRTVQRAVQIATAIAPEARDAIREAPVADNQQELLRLACMTPEEQVPVALKLAAGEAKTVRDASRQVRKEQTARAGRKANTPDSVTLHRGDFRVVGKDLADASFDAIITDPPYSQEHVPLYGDLAKLAARVLKPGGSLLAMCGQSYLPDILALMCPHIRYHWTVSYQTPGGQAVQLWGRRVNTFWKPVVWFVKGDGYEGEWTGDVVKSQVNDNDKRFSDWGQSESGMADLVERFTGANDLILDPFLGGGTTAVVAVRLGRRCVGIDADANQLDIARGRLAGAA